MKQSIELYVKIHNNREESYIVLKELISRITISLSFLVILLDFITSIIYSSFP
jgi:hypothetical protein